ncbi:protein of unknown function [Pseudorhizobium banfieldiae]|uniref:Uncharacterized protein n=1 Tax=Pseudorhizobium banfieldiae TaxID=1125847 RepID=L0NDC8_9HYPH|nr:hypothetical protein [Pseudorhizobium banfieldiae]CAD6606051.1 hypothetical protein RNT25_01772 [arsenite-oxidising bacterium NT-25]CCF19118.1 protein of unknown function [Pseudorhizobium banfieldiae]
MTHQPKCHACAERRRSPTGGARGLVVAVQCHECGIHYGIPVNKAAEALQRIRDRLDGKWYDPHGDLESDIRSVFRKLDGVAES